VTLRLHSAKRASAPYRVRVALQLKGVPFELAPVDLLAGQQSGADYDRLNPQHLVPTLETPNGPLTQSLAIIEWLDETFPEPPLLPAEPFARARIRSFAAIIACDIHPVNNLRVLTALADMGAGRPEQAAWARRWITDGLTALEPVVARHGRGFAIGERPTLADCCLVPQLYNARRFETDLTPFPAILAAEAMALAHPAFRAAHPDAHPD
jgi:maleylacetoacetate isomerase/maleylpyruvate isomerase